MSEVWGLPMRTVRAVTMLAVVLGCLFVSAAPAAAASTVTLHGGDAVYVPHITGDPGPPTLTFDVTADPADTSVTVVAEVGGGPFDFSKLNPNCTVGADGSNSCPVSGSQSLTLTFNETDLNGMVLSAKSATVTVTATIGGASATGHVLVRPQSDLRATDLHVSGSQAPTLGFSVGNLGPSGSASTRIVVTGFRTRPPGTLPTGCVWSARVTVTCTRHGQPTVDDSGPMQFPVQPAQVGCLYRVVVTGFYPDPRGSNNTATTRGPGPCLATGTLPSTTRPTSPSATPSSPGDPASSNPAGGSPSSPGTVLAGDTASPNDGKTLGQALIALSGILLLALVVVAFVGFRRPPGTWPGQ